MSWVRWLAVISALLLIAIAGAAISSPSTPTLPPPVLLEGEAPASTPANGGVTVVTPTVVDLEEGEGQETRGDDDDHEEDSDGDASDDDD